MRTPPAGDAMSLMGDYGLASLPVVEQNKLSGRVTLLAIHRVAEKERQTVQVKDVMSRESHVGLPR